jgi:hypothetical protein
MTTISVATPWQQVANADRTAWTPSLNSDYPGTTWVDTSGLTTAQIAAGGAVGSVQVTASPATAEAIQANPKYQQPAIAPQSQVQTV